jgi:hypothetical protein
LELEPHVARQCLQYACGRVPVSCGIRMGLLLSIFCFRADLDSCYGRTKSEAKASQKKS